MNYAELAYNLAAHIRQAVRPLIGRAESRNVAGIAASGDATFRIDEVAEDAVVDFIRRKNLNLAYYTEDAGLRSFGKPQATLIIDPIDGSRGAIAGFECCVVSVAITDYKESINLSDVRGACVYEIKEDRAYLAQRRSGVIILADGKETASRRANTEQIENAAWSAEIAGRPSALISRVLESAIDASSIKGGFFILNSTAFSLTRLASGQLSAVVDIGGRLLKDVPQSRNIFLEAGGGTVVGLFPYDFAAAALIAKEAGCVVTDACGRPLDDVNLLDASEMNIQSIVAAANPRLHSKFMEMVEAGFNKVR